MPPKPNQKLPPKICSQFTKNGCHGHALLDFQLMYFKLNLIGKLPLRAIEFLSCSSLSSCAKYGGDCRFQRALSRGGWRGRGGGAAGRRRRQARKKDYRDTLQPAQPTGTPPCHGAYVHAPCTRANFTHSNHINILPSEPMRRLHAEWTLQCCSTSLAMLIITNASPLQMCRSTGNAPLAYIRRERNR